MMYDEIAVEMRGVVVRGTAAEPGQILASNVVRELAAGKGFLFSDHGESELRGFEDPVRLFDVSWQRE